MKRHRVQRPTWSRTEAIILRRRHEPPPHRVLLDISHAARELLAAHDLTFVEAAHPHIVLALQAEGESALDELHRLLKRNIRSGRKQSVEMVGHDNERMQEKLPLTAVVKDRPLKQLRRCRDLKKASAFSRHGGNQIRPSFLRREPHLSSINEKPAAKAPFFARLHPGA